MLNYTNRESKEIIHDLYNELVQEKTKNCQDILDVLLTVYERLESQLANPCLVNRLAKFLHFNAFTNKIRFTTKQEALVGELNEIAKTSGQSGVYRADYLDKSQFR